MCMTHAQFPRVYRYAYNDARHWGTRQPAATPRNACSRLAQLSPASPSRHQGLGPTADLPPVASTRLGIRGNASGRPGHAGPASCLVRRPRFISCHPARGTLHSPLPQDSERPSTTANKVLDVDARSTKKATTTARRQHGVGKVYTSTAAVRNGALNQKSKERKDGRRCPWGLADSVYAARLPWKMRHGGPSGKPSSPAAAAARCCGSKKCRAFRSRRPGSAVSASV